MTSSMILPIISTGALLGLVFLFRRTGAPGNRFVIFSFLLFGVVLGLASAFLWPQDLGVFLNVFGTAAGDWTYQAAIQLIGNPNSGQAHFTIPWIFRIPQVYAWVSPVLYGAIGWLVQIGYDQINKKHMPSRTVSPGSGSDDRKWP